MNGRKPTLELLLRYLDNDLPSDERTDVEELLRQDQAAREMFREIAQQAVVVADVARSVAGRAWRKPPKSPATSGDVWQDARDYCEPLPPSRFSL